MFNLVVVITIVIDITILITIAIAVNNTPDTHIKTYSNHSRKWGANMGKKGTNYFSSAN
jgi:hypothetical protein